MINTVFYPLSIEPFANACSKNPLGAGKRIVGMDKEVKKEAGEQREKDRQC